MTYRELLDFVGQPLAADEAARIVGELSEPFDPKYIEWKPQVKSRDGRKAMAAAYADIRAYIDRLNQVVGRQNWVHTIEVRPVDYHGGREASLRSKVLVMVSVAIRGLGIGADLGESQTEDANAFTSAFAQAFKRACVQFGLGRYLYEIENRWYELDEYGQWVKGKEPQLPDWAVPGGRPSPKPARAAQPRKSQAPQDAGPAAEAAAGDAGRPPVVELPEEAPVRASQPACSECGGAIADAEVNGRRYPAAQIIAVSMKRYGRPVCASCGVALKKAARPA